MKGALLLSAITLTLTTICDTSQGRN